MNFDCYATLFYEDGQYLDTTSDAATTYTFLDSQGNPVDSQSDGGDFIDSISSRLLLYSNLVPGTYTIRVSTTTQTGEAVQNDLPFIVDGVVSP
jgi:hypothetical protein